ncbi:hypothetical protein [Streptomyces sp. NPDC005548]|uniref:hypothetical protein n=1 Tax=Streptomyces sp. NPDC005548 TaxID=3364724 RepID=UPI003682DD59
MPAAPELPTTHSHGMCLLHGDYHPMTGDCWTITADWFFDHQHLPDGEARNWYLAEVEQAMLNQLVPLAPPADPRSPR